MIIIRTDEDAVRPDRAALVVYDMQVGILAQMPQGGEVLAKVLDLLALARSAGMPVIFMRHMSLPRRLMGAFQLRQAMAWQRTDDPDAVAPWFLRDSPGFALAPELSPREDEVVFDKIAFSAFEGTPLSMALRDLGLQAFLICGVATEIGIDPTVRQGADLGFVPVVVTDACSAGHAECGDRAIENMRHMGDAILTDTDRVRALLS